MARELYEDYPDPMPSFAYLGGEQGRGRLESALAEPQQTWGGLYLHRTVFDKAAALFRSIVADHPLVDGNKRTGLTATFVFLTINRYFFWMPRHEAVALALSIAEGRMDVRQISICLRRNSLRRDRAANMRPAELALYSSAYFREIGAAARKLRNLIVHSPHAA